MQNKPVSFLVTMGKTTKQKQHWILYTTYYKKVGKMKTLTVDVKTKFATKIPKQLFYKVNKFKK